MQRASTASIHLRLLLASLVILPAFLGVTALVLDRAFSNYQMESQADSMRLQQLLLRRLLILAFPIWVTTSRMGTELRCILERR